MAGDVHITDAATLVALRDAALRDGGLMGVALIDMVRQFGAASKGAAPSEAFAVGSMAAANRLHRKL
jgi:hypothetical protein